MLLNETVTYPTAEILFIWHYFRKSLISLLKIRLIPKHIIDVLCYFYTHLYD